MASVTKTFKEDFYSNYKSTWTLVLSGTDLTVTTANQNLKYTHPTLTAKYVYSSKSYGSVLLEGIIYARYATANYRLGTIGKAKESSSGWLTKMTSGTAYTIANATNSTNGTPPVLYTVPASRYFDSSNPTVNALDIIARSYQTDTGWTTIYLDSGAKSSAENNNSTDKYNGYPDSDNVNVYWGKIGTIYYRVPPTIGTPTISKNTDGYYAGKTRVTVTVSSTAGYGGYISSTKLTIGSQSVSITGGTAANPANGSMYIDLNATGTFTPTLTVTDSRGQTATKSLTAITVSTYNSPAAVLNVERADSAGASNPSGTYALLTTQITYTSGAGKLAKPAVYVGSSSTETAVTWYTSRNSAGIVSGAISDWTNYHPTSPVVLYGLTGGIFSPDSAYTIKLTPKDQYGSGNSVEKQLPSQFFPLDFYQGGEGVAIGQMAVRNGLDVNMNTHFFQDVYFGSQKVSDIVFGSTVGGSGASSLQITDANCIGRSFIVATAMDISANVTYAQFVNHVSSTDIRSADGQIRFYFSSTLSANTRVNYIAW